MDTGGYYNRGSGGAGRGRGRRFGEQGGGRRGGRGGRGGDDQNQPWGRGGLVQIGGDPAPPRSQGFRPVQAYRPTQGGVPAARPVLAESTGPTGGHGRGRAAGVGGRSVWGPSPSTVAGPSRRPPKPIPDETNSIKKWKIMTYNVWFREDLEMHMRMNALGYLIQLHAPDFICFQEVTPNIYHIFEQSSWWKAYSCSVSNVMASTRSYFCMQLSKLPVRSYSTKPFNNSIMGRELCVAEVEIEENTPLIFATTHLESPCPAPPKWDQMYSKERVFQANEALTFLKKYPNTIFCGDMNWNEKLDGRFPLLDGWVDSWEQVKPGDDGYTYDTKSNKMLSGNRTLQKRLDRAICKLRDFKICGIDMIGMEAIPGLSYVKEKKVRKEVVKMELPVLPSDHYGLLLTISTK